MLGVVRGLLRNRQTKNLRGNMLPKRGNNQYYKGKGVPKVGTISKRGRFVPFINLDKLLDLKIPDLTGFRLKAYVSHETPLVPKQS